MISYVMLKSWASLAKKAVALLARQCVGNIEKKIKVTRFMILDHVACGSWHFRQSAAGEKTTILEPKAAARTLWILLLDMVCSQLLLDIHENVVVHGKWVSSPLLSWEIQCFSHCDPWFLGWPIMTQHLRSTARNPAGALSSWRASDNLTSA